MQHSGPVITVCDNPVVRTYDQFFSASECAHIIEHASSQMTRAVVSGTQSGIKSAGRTGQVGWLKHTVSDTVSQCVARLADLVEIPASHAESLQVIYYGENQEYRPHYDAWEHHTDRGIRCMARGGQRLVTCLVYLNDTFKGGGTVFPNLDVEVQPREGRLVYFQNCPQGSNVRNDDTLHGGSPVRSGEKWACNLWFREAPYR